MRPIDLEMSATHICADGNEVSLLDLCVSESGDPLHELVQREEAEAKYNEMIIPHTIVSFSWDNGPTSERQQMINTLFPESETKSEPKGNTMNLKMIVSQLDLLPEADVARHINSLLYPIRRPMLIECAKDEPNVTLITTLRTLNNEIASSMPEKVHSMDSTAAFVFQASEDKRDEATRLGAARQRVMLLCADGKLPKPKSKAELDKMIALEMQRDEDRVVENFSKSCEAISFLDQLHDEDEYDEGDLPEWINEAVVGKLVDIGVSVYRDAVRRLDRAKFDFQRTAPNAAKEGALQLLAHFEVTEASIQTVLEKSRITTQELFDRLEHPETSLDKPPKDTTASGKKKMHRIKKVAAQGITSADMGAASGVK